MANVSPVSPSSQAEGAPNGRPVALAAASFAEAMQSVLAFNNSYRNIQVEQQAQAALQQAVEQFYQKMAGLLNFTQLIALANRLKTTPGLSNEAKALFARQASSLTNSFNNLLSQDGGKLGSNYKAWLQWLQFSNAANSPEAKALIQQLAAFIDKNVNINPIFDDNLADMLEKDDPALLNSLVKLFQKFVPQLTKSDILSYLGKFNSGSWANPEDGPAWENTNNTIATAIICGLFANWLDPSADPDDPSYNPAGSAAQAAFALVTGQMGINVSHSSDQVGEEQSPTQIIIDQIQQSFNRQNAILNSFAQTAQDISHTVNSLS